MQIVANIVFVFCLYLIVALSVYISYVSSKWLNFIYAFTITIVSYISLTLSRSLLIHIYIANLLAIFLSCFFTTLFSSFLLRANRSTIVNLLVALFVYTILQNFISLYYGDAIRSMRSVEIAIGYQIWGAYITTVQIICIITAGTIFFGVILLFYNTSFGKKFRAVSENIELSSIYGISTKKIILVATIISSALAATAGILYAYDTNLNPLMGFNLFLYGIVAMIIGGVGSFKGLLFGSLLLATAQNLVAYYLDTKWMDAATYIILIAFLLWRPLGFSGKRLKKIEI